MYIQKMCNMEQRQLYKQKSNMISADKNLQNSYFYLFNTLEETETYWSDGRTVR